MRVRMSLERIAFMTREMSEAGIAFEDVARQFHAHLFNYLSKLAGDQAEDLLQETLLRASLNYANIRESSSERAVRSWMFRIATNVAMDHFRSRRIGDSRDTREGFDHSYDECSNLPDTRSKGAEESYIIEEMNECISRMIERLPQTYRAVMLLYHFEGLSIAEISSACGLSVSAVKVRLHRGKQLLRNELNGACDFYRDGDSTLRCSEKPSSPARTSDGRRTAE